MNITHDFDNLQFTDEADVNLGIEYTKHVGAYRITPQGTKDGTIDFCYVKKPKWIHRMGCKLFLGWTWIDFD